MKLLLFLPIAFLLLSISTFNKNVAHNKNEPSNFELLLGNWHYQKMDGDQEIWTRVKNNGAYAELHIKRNLTLRFSHLTDWCGVASTYEGKWTLNNNELNIKYSGVIAQRRRILGKKRTFPVQAEGAVELIRITSDTLIIEGDLHYYK